jgi:thiol-disulfide isomerase/thioredoxin
MPKKTKLRTSKRRNRNNTNNSLNNMVSNLDITDCLLIIIVILVVYYLLMYTGKGREGYTNHNNNLKPTMMLFHAKWCGHCVRFMPEWKKFKKQAKINVIEYEADEDSDKMSENNVKGFPTIKCSTNSGDVKEFNGERTVAGLNAFAEECSK